MISNGGCVVAVLQVWLSSWSCVVEVGLLCSRLDIKDRLSPSASS